MNLSEFTQKTFTGIDAFPPSLLKEQEEQKEGGN